MWSNAVGIVSHFRQARVNCSSRLDSRLRGNDEWEVTSKLTIKSASTGHAKQRVGLA